LFGLVKLLDILCDVPIELQIGSFGIEVFARTLADSEHISFGIRFLFEG